MNDDFSDINSKDGLISVKNEEILIENPTGLGRYPRLSSGEYVELYLDDELVKGEVVVSESNQNLINWEIKEPEMEKEFTLEISENKLKAYLTLELNPALKLKIRDVEPANQVKIRTEVVERKFSEVAKEEIKNILQQKNVIYGIKEEKLDKFVNSRRSISGIVAEGKECIEGEDAKVVPSQLYEQHYLDSFHNINSFTTGEVIAYKKQAVAGKAGKNIFGEEIPPPQVTEIELKAGEGVKLSEDGTRAIASINGQPRIDTRGDQVVVSVVKQYVIENDIDKTTGSINYEGDLVVLGDIHDYFNVKVGRDLKVKGNIANANIAANGNVMINQNIISSNLTVGNYIDPDLKAELEIVIGKLNRLQQAIDQIIGEARKRKNLTANIRVGKIIRLLIINKFNGLPGLIKEVYKKIDKNLNELRNTFEEIIPYVRNINKLDGLSRKDIFSEFYQDVKEIMRKSNQEHNRLNVYTGYIQNSTINVYGSVIVDKQGCYNSTINVGQDIIIKNENGFLRGGKYKAANQIFSYAMGSKLSSTTFEVGNRIYTEKIIGTLIIKAPRDRIEANPGQGILNLKVDDEGKLKQASKEPDLTDLLDNQD